MLPGFSGYLRPERGESRLRSTTVHARWALFVSLALAGCTGTLSGEDGPLGGASAGDGDAGGDGDGATGDGDANPNHSDNPIDNVAPPECPTDDPFVGTSVIRRITNHQYNRTALLLFGDDSSPADQFPVETREEGYDNQASSQHVQGPQVIAWEVAATSLAAKVSQDLDGFLACDTTAEGVDGCFSAALPGLMTRVLRSEPTAEEVARYQSFYDELRVEASGPRAVELIVRALLLAPRFLFVVEEGAEAENGTYRLGGYELASRLSFLLWNQAPDEALLTAAASGVLDTKEGVAGEARRLLEDPRAADTIRDFHSQWIDLGEIDNMVVAEGYDEALKDAAKKEIEWFLEDWYETGGGIVSDLFTSRRALVDEQLASLYGVNSPAGEEVVELPEGQRAGLLTRAVFLATHGIPPTRGDFILTRVLCTPLPPLSFMPPAPPDLGESATTRQRFERHAEDPCAASCHGVLDPVGFPFEHYANTGIWRDTENGQPIDATATLTLSAESGVEGAVDGAIELSEKIAHSPLASNCLGENWFRYSQGRGAVAQDNCSVEAMQGALGEVGDVRDLLVELTQTDAFLFIRKEGL